MLGSRGVLSGLVAWGKQGRGLTLQSENMRQIAHSLLEGLLIEKAIPATPGLVDLGVELRAEAKCSQVGQGVSSPDVDIKSEVLLDGVVEGDLVPKTNSSLVKGEAVISLKDLGIVMMSLCDAYEIDGVEIPEGMLGANHLT